MWIQVTDLRNWYKTDIGRTAKRVLRRRLRRLLPVQQPKRVLVIGYGFPYMRLFCDTEVVHLCPKSIGALRFPEEGKNKALMGYEDELPFAESTFDYVFVCHGLEFADRPTDMLNEIWRVLKGQGKVLFMVPNRHSPWSRIEETPFAKGKPYSARELDSLLKEQNYLVTQSGYGLYFPPSSSKLCLKFFDLFEKAGDRWFAVMGGIVLMEAKKNLFGGQPVQDARPKFRTQLEPALGTNYKNEKSSH